MLKDTTVEACYMRMVNEREQIKCTIFLSERFTIENKITKLIVLHLILQYEGLILRFLMLEVGRRRFRVSGFSFTGTGKFVHDDEDVEPSEEGLRVRL